MSKIKSRKPPKKKKNSPMTLPLPLDPALKEQMKKKWDKNVEIGNVEIYE